LKLATRAAVYGAPPQRPARRPSTLISKLNVRFSSGADDRSGSIAPFRFLNQLTLDHFSRGPAVPNRWRSEISSPPRRRRATSAAPWLRSFRRWVFCGMNGRSWPES